jgi:sialic acid synthase SpsE
MSLPNYKKIEPNNSCNNSCNNIYNEVKEMELTKLSKTELLAKCEELGITKCKSKNKGELIELINQTQTYKNALVKSTIEFIIDDNEEIIIEPSSASINSEYKLVDLFCGTGAFSYAFHQTNKVETI